MVKQNEVVLKCKQLKMYTCSHVFSECACIEVVHLGEIDRTVYFKEYIGLLSSSMLSLSVQIGRYSYG